VKVNISEQVRDFILCLAPDPRKYMRRALRSLESEKGDIKALEHDLAGYFRLRVRSYRIIFTYRTTTPPDTVEIECIYCESRSIVYEAFAAISAKLHTPIKP